METSKQLLYGQKRACGACEDCRVYRSMVGGGCSMAVVLTERDAEALRWIGEQYAVRRDVGAVLLGQLGGRAPLSEGGVRRVENRWEKAGLVGRGSVTGSAIWVWLTHRGMNTTGLRWTAWQPTPWRLAHVHAVAVTRLALQCQLSDATWVCERELRAVAARLGDRGHLPDGIVVLGDGRRVAVEVELTPKSPGRTRDIVAELACGDFAQVWYFAAPPAARVVNRAAAEWPTVSVWPLPTLPDTDRPVVRCASQHLGPALPQG